MNITKSHFEMHSRFRNGVFVFSILIFLLLILFYFYPSHQGEVTSLKELAEFQSQIDCLKKEAILVKKAYDLKPFNPNFISDYKGYVLGLSPVELDRLYRYRKRGKWINSITDFKKVTAVSDSLLTVISPLFSFPDWTQGSKKTISFSKNKDPIKSFAKKGDLNEIDMETLEKEIGVPDFIAERIVAYRNKIEGFVSDLQLKDVSGLYDHQRTKILLSYTVKTPVKINKVNINTATVKELMSVPYFDFETALEIKDFVLENNGILDFKELVKIEGFSLEKIDRIELYLRLN